MGFKRLTLVSGLLGLSTALAWATACSTDNSMGATSGSSTGSSGSSGSTSGEDASSSQADGSSGAITDAAAEGGTLGLLIDDMSVVQQGTEIRLPIPKGQTPGSYYTYSDRDKAVSNYLGIMSLVTGTSQLVDAPVTPAVSNADGSKVVGDLCFGGRVVGYAGLGMSFAYGNAPDATPETGVSLPTPFDASHYSGISFYILVDPSDAAAPSLRFDVPDTQTADPVSFPASQCNVDGGACDDDFGSDITYTPGVWTKVSLAWDELSEQGFGSPSFSAVKTSQLIGMKWQANGDGFDAGTESFNFCISDIYFTP